MLTFLARLYSESLADDFRKHSWQNMLASTFGKTHVDPPSCELRLSDLLLVEGELPRLTLSQLSRKCSSSRTLNALVLVEPTMA